VLKLLKDSFGPGDKLVEIEPFSPFAASSPYFSSLAVVTPNGKRRLLLVNKRDREFQLSIPGASGGQLSVVDQSTAFDPPTSSKLQSEKVKVKGLGVAVVTLP
jgi:hypothetical protein